MKKFFKQAEAGAVDGGFTVLLDRRAPSNNGSIISPLRRNS